MGIDDLIVEIEKARIVCVKLDIDWDSIKTDYVIPKKNDNPWTGELG